MALLLVALGCVLTWQTRVGLDHIDRMMDERSETLQRMVATEVRNVARYGKARVARLDEVLADVAASPDVLGVRLERGDGTVQLSQGDIPSSVPDEVLAGRGHTLQGTVILRGGPVHIETQGCGSCHSCEAACELMGEHEIAGDYRVVLAIDGRPYLQLRQMVWAQGTAGGVLLLALALSLWLFQRQLERSSSMLSALAVADERARSFERLGRLAGGLAHEIRNPVSSLRGFAQLIAEDVQEGSPSREYAQLMVTELDAITRRVNRLRDLARPTPPAFEAHDPASIVRKVSALLAPDLDAHGLHLELDLPTELGLRAYLDVDRFRDMLVNLVINAIEASPRGGTITVRVAFEEDDGSFVLEVADQGPGIPEEERDRALRPFHSTKPGGMGLGLAVAQQAAEDHGSRLEIADNDGGGALLRVRWPGRTLVGAP